MFIYKHVYLSPERYTYPKMNEKDISLLHNKGIIDGKTRDSLIFEIEEKKKSKKPDVLYEGLTNSQFNALMKKTTQSNHKLAYRLGYYSGLRVSEIIKLLPTDIDLVGRTIFIRRGKNRKDRKAWTPKDLTEEDLKLLPLDLTKVALKKAFNRHSIKAGFNKVRFIKGEEYSKDTRRQKNKYEYSIHSLRHGFAVNCMNAGVPLNHIQKLLGHESIQTTSRYLEINPKHIMDDAFERGL